MALQADVYGVDGKVSGKVSLPKIVFGAKINSILMAQAVNIYLSNQRKAHAKTKTRGEVIGSTRKIYKQKGTGHARHGDIKAPVFVGGGKAHGPNGEQNYKRSFPEKMREVALNSALSSKVKDEKVMILDGAETMEGKTKEIVKIINGFPLKSKKGEILIVLPKKMEKFSRAVRNIEGVTLTNVKNLNTYQILTSDLIVLTKEALPFFEEKKK